MKTELARTAHTPAAIGTDTPPIGWSDTMNATITSQKKQKEAREREVQSAKNHLCNAIFQMIIPLALYCSNYNKNCPGRLNLWLKMQMYLCNLYLLINLLVIGIDVNIGIHMMIMLKTVVLLWALGQCATIEAESRINIRRV